MGLVTCVVVTHALWGLTASGYALDWPCGVAAGILTAHVTALTRGLGVRMRDCVWTGIISAVSFLALYLLAIAIGSHISYEWVSDPWSRALLEAGVTLVAAALVACASLAVSLACALRAQRGRRGAR